MTEQPRGEYGVIVLDRRWGYDPKGIMAAFEFAQKPTKDDIAEVRVEVERRIKIPYDLYLIIRNQPGSMAPI
jgi:hypothetical protein